MQRLTADSVELYMKLLVVTLFRGGYPHEIIVCMFNKLFDEPDTTGEALKKAWSPQRIVREKSQRALWQLAQDLERDYTAAAALDPEPVAACFQLLHRQMVCRVEEIIKPKDQTARSRWKPIRNRFVGQTTLSSYYGKNPEADISNWSYKVFRTVKQVMLSENWLQRPYEQLLVEAAVPLGC